MSRLIKIIINGKTIETEGEITNYEDIVNGSGLMYRRDYTVTYSYSDNKKGGTLFRSFGNVGCRPLFLQDGMIFNVICTDNA